MDGTWNGTRIGVLFTWTGELRPDYKMVNNQIRPIKNLHSSSYFHGLLFSPSTVFADFEQAVHSSIKAVWPNAFIKGCRFHVGQSWYRAIQRFGLGKDYKLGNDVAIFLKSIFGLPLATVSEQSVKRKNLLKSRCSNFGQDIAIRMTLAIQNAYKYYSHDSGQLLTIPTNL